MTPGMGADIVAPIREVLMKAAGGDMQFPAGAVIDGSLSRDPGNPTRVDVLRPGLFLGRVTASNKYATSVLGQLEAALTSAGTTLKTSSTTATEIIRRIGATGTFKVTGPPTAGGTVRTLTATYSAVGAGAGVNEVQTIVNGAAGTSGTFRLGITTPLGVVMWTTPIAYSASAATISTALDVATGVVAGVVCTGTTPWSTTNTGTFTFSGVGYTALPQQPIQVDNTLCLDTNSAAVVSTVVRTVLGVPAVGNITVTALGINDVQQVNFPIASTGGSVVIEFTLASGVRTRTAAISWNATDATYLASINSALDTATGVGSAIVATAISAVDTDYGFVLTFSGTGYAAIAQPLVAITTFPTSSTSYSVTHTTTGQAGAFVTGSLIQPTDGSENIRTLFIPDNKSGAIVTNFALANIDVSLANLPMGGCVRTAMLIDYPQDASGKAAVKAALRTWGGVWTFDDDFIGASV
jgi:hypothetical protein